MQLESLKGFQPSSYYPVDKVAAFRSIELPKISKASSSWQHALFVVKVAVERKVVIEPPSLTPEGSHHHVIRSLGLRGQQ